MSEGSPPDRPIERLAAAAFAVAAVAAVVLMLVYWRGGQPQLEGLLIAITFVALGVGLALWANRLLGGGPYVEQREELVATPAEAAALQADLERHGVVQRRTLLRRTLAVAVAAIGAAALFPIRSLGPKPGRALLHTGWSKGTRVVTIDGRPVRAADVPEGGLLTVFPEGHAGSADGQAVMVRVEPSLLRLPSGRQSWTVDGIIAYSKVCTHAGCPVGLYEADLHQLLCPCHQSAFDVLTGATPLSGPAAWPLPQLPLEQGDDGVLRSTQDFSEPVGPGWWRA
jgi:ubiquinol-cytochrome c reductase iron-sulfur subunit